MEKTTLKVKTLKFKNQQTKEDGYISRAVTNGTVGFDDLCERASQNTTMHPREISLAFGLMLDAVRDALLEGNTVVLDQIGRLSPSITSKWTKKEKEQKLADMTTGVRFRPTQLIKSTIARTKLTWVDGKNDDK